MQGQFQKKNIHAADMFIFILLLDYYVLNPIHIVDIVALMSK